MLEDDIEKCVNPSTNSNSTQENDNNTIKGVGEFKDIDLSHSSHSTIHNTSHNTSDNTSHSSIVNSIENERDGILECILDSRLFLKHHDSLDFTCASPGLPVNDNSYHINRINPSCNINRINPSCNIKRINPSLSNFTLGSMQHRILIVFSFSLSFLSNFVGHFIREPLFTTKVNIQKSFKSTTLQLGYLDISYLTLYGIGHLVTPFVFSRSYVIIFVSIFHLFLSGTHFILYLAESLGWFILIYGVTGFSCSVLWLSIYNDLRTWLPLKHRFMLLTIWCCSSELGLSLGTIMCAHIQTETRWKILFMITAFVNLFAAVLLFTCYRNPPRNSDPNSYLNTNVNTDHPTDYPNIDNPTDNHSSEYPNTFDPNTFDMINEFTIFDPIKLSKNNIKNISRYFRGIRDSNSDVVGLCKNMWEMSTKVVMGHLNLMKRIKYLFIYIFGYTCLRSARNCFAFWISFYLTTKLKYSIKSGIYATFVFQMGSCLGSLVAGALSKLLLKKYHLLSCAIAALFSFLLCPFIYFIEPNSVWKTFSFVFTFGLVTNCTDLLITTRGLKTLCESSQQGGEVDDYSVSLGTTFSISTFLSVLYGYISTYIAHHYGWDKMFLYLCVLMLLSTGAFGVPSRKEILKYIQSIL